MADPNLAPEVVSFFDPVTGTGTHVVIEPAGVHCAIVDPVLDYEPKSATTDTVSARRVSDFVRDRGLVVDWILETHVHADHLSAAALLAAEFGARVGIGAQVREVQGVFADLFDAEADFATDGRQFGALFEDGATLTIGSLEGRVMHTPGHTPACVTYVLGDAAFVGDTLFAPDFGTARCDFPGGDARTLYRSVRRLLSELPPSTRLFLCHDYPPTDRPVRLQYTVAEQREANVHVRDDVEEDAFVELRRARDATLEMPVLILPSVQVNMRAGHLPPAAGNGRRYLRIPVDVFERHGGAVRDDDDAPLKGVA